ncbi:hypothetical protein HAV15_004101 [Penicillium sp. str. |nr:hypothetical protein HAV15_004101 [Penicillium sp. str. \
MTDQYAHLVREDFDWWEDVESDIAMKTKAVTPITSTAPKLENEYASLLVRQKFDWWEDVENDITKNTKALAGGTNIPTTDTKNLGTACTGPATAIKLDGEYAQPSVREHCDSPDDVENDTAMKDDNDSQSPVSNDCWKDVDNDITVDTKALTVTPTSPTTARNPEGTDAQTPFHCDCSKDSENDITVETEDLAVISTSPTAASDLVPISTFISRIRAKTQRLIIAPLENDEFVQLLLNEHDNWPDDATNDTAVGTGDLAVQNELLPTTNGPINEDCNWPEDAESDISIGTEDLASTSELHATTNGPVTAVELDDTYAQLSDPDTSNQFIDEYEYRELIGREDPAIHHWNWFGWPVYQPTTTPPAVSLAFMQAEPKVPQGRDRLRVASIMNRAIHQIDPVILRVSRGNEAVLQTHGSALVEACNDDTYNYYSLHGNWMNDGFAMRQIIVPDVAGTPAVRSTSDGNFAIGNGIFENGPLISRNEWVDWQDELVAATKQSSGFPRKMTWKPSPSNLKIKSMASEQLPLNQLLAYSFVPLEILSNIIKKAGVAPKKMIYAPISSSTGIMETVTRKAWSGRKSIPDTPITIRPGIMGDLIKKTWPTPCDSLRKSFVFPSSAQS